MNDEQIFELAEKCAFQDDFGYWNFKDEGLLDFVFLVQKSLGETVAWVGLTDKEVSELYLAAGIIPWTKHTVGPNSDIGDGVYTTPLVEDGMDGDGTCLRQFAQLIEVKLKEKNHG